MFKKTWQYITGFFALLAGIFFYSKYRNESTLEDNQKANDEVNELEGRLKENESRIDENDKKIEEIDNRIVEVENESNEKPIDSIVDDLNDRYDS